MSSFCHTIYLLCFSFNQVDPEEPLIYINAVYHSTPLQKSSMQYSYCPTSFHQLDIIFNDTARLVSLIHLCTFTCKQVLEQPMCKIAPLYAVVIRDKRHANTVSNKRYKLTIRLVMRLISNDYFLHRTMTPNKTLASFKSVVKL